MADIFISYKSDRRPVAEHLAEVLELHGYSVWFDYALLSGNDFSRQIEQELKAAKAVIVLWCDLSVESDWVRSEARFAKRTEKFCPVKIYPCDLPIEFDGDQTQDLTGWDSAPKPFEPGALLGEIAQRVGKKPKPNLEGLERAAQAWRRFGSQRIGELGMIDPIETREEGTAPNYVAATAPRAASGTTAYVPSGREKNGSAVKWLVPGVLGVGALVLGGIYGPGLLSGDDDDNSDAGEVQAELTIQPLVTAATERVPEPASTASSVPDVQTEPEPQRITPTAAEVIGEAAASVATLTPDQPTDAVVDAAAAPVVEVPIVAAPVATPVADVPTERASVADPVAAPVLAPTFGKKAPDEVDSFGGGQITSPLPTDPNQLIVGNWDCVATGPDMVGDYRMTLGAGNSMSAFGTFDGFDQSTGMSISMDFNLSGQWRVSGTTLSQNIVRFDVSNLFLDGMTLFELAGPNAAAMEQQLEQEAVNEAANNPNTTITRLTSSELVTSDGSETTQCFRG